MIQLQAGKLRCALAPDLGGCVAGLWLGETAVLHSTPPGRPATARQAGCHALVPFSNRIGQSASVVWQGTQQPLVQQHGDAPHAIHGVAWQRPWSVLDQDEASVLLAYEHRADAHWPFAFDCSHMLRLRPGALEMTLAVTNQSAQPAPGGLGWQVALPAGPGARAAWRAAGQWELGPGWLPVVRKAASPVDAALAGLGLEQCYDGWDGVAEWQDAALRVRLASTLARLVAFADPAAGELRLAPVSHLPNAVHLYAAGASAGDLGLQLLQPGESLVAQLAIEVEAVA